jgi:hypothetical protein
MVRFEIEGDEKKIEKLEDLGGRSKLGFFLV